MDKEVEDEDMRYLENMDLLYHVFPTGRSKSLSEHSRGTKIPSRRSGTFHRSEVKTQLPSLSWVEFHDRSVLTSLQDLVAPWIA